MGLSCLIETKMVPGEFPFQKCKELLMSELCLCLKDSIDLLSCFLCETWLVGVGWKFSVTDTEITISWGDTVFHLSDE